MTIRPDDILTHQAGTTHAYDLPWEPSGLARVEHATPSHLLHTLTVSLTGRRLELSGGVAGAHYRVRVGEHTLRVHVVPVDRAALAPLAARPDPAVDWIEVPAEPTLIEVH